MLHNMLFQDQEFKKFWEGAQLLSLPMVGRAVPLPSHTPSAPAAPRSSCLRHLPPLFKNPRSATGSCNGVGCSTDVSTVSLSGSCNSDLYRGSDSGCCLGRLPAKRTLESGAQSDRLQKVWPRPSLS